MWFNPKEKSSMPEQTEMDDLVTADLSVNDVAAQCLQSLIQSGKEGTPEDLAKLSVDLAYALANQIKKREETESLRS